MIVETVAAFVIASHYAGKPTTVECFQFGANDPTLADTLPGSSHARLSNRVCRALRRPARTERFVEALVTVIHEAEHMRGDRNEWRVECAAARKAPGALRRFYGVRDLRAWRPLVRRVTFRPGCVA